MHRKSPWNGASRGLGNLQGHAGEIRVDFCPNWELCFRHRNVPKSMKKVKVINRLTEDKPHVCSVGNIMNGNRGKYCGFY